MPTRPRRPTPRNDLPFCKRIRHRSTEQADFTSPHPHRAPREVLTMNRNNKQTNSSARTAATRAMTAKRRLRLCAVAAIASLGLNGGLLGADQGSDVGGTRSSELPTVEIIEDGTVHGCLEKQDEATLGQTFDRFVESLYIPEASPAPEAPEAPEAAEAAEAVKVAEGERTAETSPTGGWKLLSFLSNPFATADVPDVTSPAGPTKAGEATTDGSDLIETITVTSDPSQRRDAAIDSKGKAKTATSVAKAAPSATMPREAVPSSAPTFVDASGTVRLTVNDSRVITTSRPYHRVALAKTSLAEIQPLSPTQLLVTAKESGTTQLVFWDDQDEAQTLLLQSTADLRQLQDQIALLLPGEAIEVVDLNGRIALTGSASDTTVADRAMRIASGYGTVENFITVAGERQVALRIRFAEVSRTAGKEFGVNFGFQDGNNSIIGSNVGQIAPFGLATNANGAVTGLDPVSSPGPGVQLFGVGSISGDPFTYYLNALRDSNLLRLLADPELTVISGKQGEFLAGGEFPVPVPQEEGIAIEYREFGIKLIYTPIVLGDGRIRMELVTEVSDLDETIAVATGGVRVPGLRKRSTATTVELREGQTLAISGLLRSRTVASKRVTPLLGDVPVLGALFRSVRYRREETELVVLVTPRLVAALNPDEVPPVPGETWRHPNDVELMIFGQLGGDAGVGKPDDADEGGRDDRAATPANGEGTDGPRLQSRYAFTPVAPVGE